MHRNRRESRSLRRRPRRLIRCMRRGWFWFTHSRIFPEASPDMVKHSLSVYGQIFYTRALRAAAGSSRNAAADFSGPVRVAGEPEPVGHAGGPRDFSYPRRAGPVARTMDREHALGGSDATIGWGRAIRFPSFCFVVPDRFCAVAALAAQYGQLPVLGLAGARTLFDFRRAARRLALVCCATALRQCRRLHCPDALLLLAGNRPQQRALVC